MAATAYILVITGLILNIVVATNVMKQNDKLRVELHQCLHHKND